MKKNFINEEMFLKNIRFCIYNKIGITGYYIAESPLEFVKPGMLIRSDFDAFDSILNASPNLFIFLDKHGIIINTNITYFKNVFYCKENDNVLSKPLAEYFSNDIGEHNKYLYEKTIEDKVKNSFEMKINGKIFEVIIYPILENNQNVQFIVCSLNDITKKIESEKKILTYLEKERQQIGQELHDELGQYLTGISLLMESLRKKIKEENSPYLEKIETISGLIVQSINFTHNLAKGLRTVTKEGDELVLEIELLCDDIKRKFDINCIFNNKLTVEILNTQISTQIYYIAKEALNNAVKHSKPDYILVEISSDKDFVWLRVENNGVSDNKEKIRQGLGREIMSYRAKIIGANFSILKIGNNFRVEVKSLNRL